MNSMPPAVARTAAPAQWATSHLDVFAKQWVTGMVGPDFAAYARIFHPLDDGPDAPRWADVAELRGRTMHPSADWNQINIGPEELRHGRSFPGVPRIGNLLVEALSDLCAILTDHTSTPERCWFAVWDGWGWQHPGAFAVLRSTSSDEPLPPLEMAPPDWQLDLTGPTFELPGRKYHLYTGPVQVATRIGHWVTKDWFAAQSPSIFWPEDHAWCVATEVDADTTLVGGSRGLIAQVTNSPLLEALPIARGATQLDTINAG
jgi:hypothetical protein